MTIFPVYVLVALGLPWLEVIKVMEIVVEVVMITAAGLHEPV